MLISPPVIRTDARDAREDSAIDETNESILNFNFNLNLNKKRNKN